MVSKFVDKEKAEEYLIHDNAQDDKLNIADNGDADVFGDESDHQIKYKSLSWQMVSVFMIAEIVSNGMLSLPSSLAVVGIVPGVIILVFLGIFATFTSWLLVQFKLNHPQVHTMGDAGYIIFGPIGREILSTGTVIFAVFSVGSELISGQFALSSLSNNGLCTYYFTLIFAAATFIMALPRQLGKLTWLGIVSVSCILVAGIVGMAGIGASPVPNRSPVAATHSSTFYEAFLAITNPVFAYAGHFMFFILISEMKQPRDAMKAAYVLQGFSTVFYVVFAIVFYIYAGDTVASPSFLSLSPIIQKVAFGIALPNFLLGGALYAHTASKLVYVRLHRGTVHLHSHTVWGWLSWIFLNLIAVAVAFILAIAVPIFSDLIGLAAALFASWFTYGVAGFFWLYDSYHGLLKGAKSIVGLQAWRLRPMMTALAVLTILVGTFICVAGTYTTLKLIVLSYQQGVVGRPFTC